MLKIHQNEIQGEYRIIVLDAETPEVPWKRVTIILGKEDQLKSVENVDGNKLTLTLVEKE